MLDSFKEDGICDWCINRATEGEAKKQKTEREKNVSSYSKISEKCFLCAGILERVIENLVKIKRKTEKYEFNTFNVDISFLNCFEEADQYFIERNISPIFLNAAITKELQERLFEELGKPVIKQQNDLQIQIQISKKGQKIETRVKSMPLFIYGKYRKFTRKIPQTRWPCRVCRGLKCEKCDYSGLKYLSSIESLISKPFLKHTSASASKFHGAGREDIDVLMLGTGRPFIIELKDPLRRKIKLEIIQAEVNKSVETKINTLSFTTRRDVKDLKQKGSLATKTYNALVKCIDFITQNHLNKLDNYSFPIVLKQKTPKRVLHRRSDIIRAKKIYKIIVIGTKETKIELEIIAEGGTYIKEFINSDAGRTIPSLSTILGTHCECEQLNVTAIAET